MEKKNQLWKLFWSTFFLSAFTFGGGYVIVSLMKKKFVDEYHWIEEAEMLDLVAIAQSAPGAVAVNGAIVVGYRLAGIPGAFFSILGTVIPPFGIILVISAFYQAFQSNFYVGRLLEGMQAGVGAVIATVSVEMVCTVVAKKELLPIIIMIVAFLASFLLKIHAVSIILVCIGIGVIRAWIDRRKQK